jgi:succinate dehydrogenase / fumarate reductase cytochrome b subunit
MSMSILHRATGALLALGLLVLTYWWEGLATGPVAYGWVTRIMGSAFGLLVLFALSFAFWFHFLNGIRHLFWDAGRGFDKTPRQAGGWFALIGAVVLTVILFGYGWRHFA